MAAANKFKPFDGAGEQQSSVSQTIAEESAEEDDGDDAVSILPKMSWNKNYLEIINCEKIGLTFK